MRRMELAYNEMSFAQLVDTHVSIAASHYFHILANCTVPFPLVNISLVNLI